MNGTMKFTRRVNLGNYEHTEFTAEISYSTVDEDDYLDQKAIIDQAADLAVEIAEVRLGLRKPSQPAEAATVATMEKAASIEVLERQVHRPVIVEEFAEPIFSTAPGSIPPANVMGKFVSIGGNVAVPSTMTEAEIALCDAEDPLFAGVALPEAANPELPELTDGLDIDAELAAVPEEIDNDALHAHCRAYVKKHNGRQPAITALRKLRDKFGTQIDYIPQERRSDFVAQMEALTP